MPLLSIYKRRHSKTLMNIADSVRLDAIQRFNSRIPASLYCLPADLTCHICQYLAFAEPFCLMISCARFWDARTTIKAFDRVQQRLSATSTAHNDREFFEARFRILRLMELDKILGKGIKSFCCWACKRTHRRARFRKNPRKHPIILNHSIEEQILICLGSTRRCRKYEGGLIWVGMCMRYPGPSSGF